MIGYRYFWEIYPKSIYIAESAYQAGDVINIGVNIDWQSSDVRDFTLNVFTKQQFEIVDFYTK